MSGSPVQTRPRSAGEEPLPVDVIEGRTYWWCRCGRSATQPFCDGSHNQPDCALTPLAWVAPRTGTVFFCACKRTKKAPICDGAHGIAPPA